MATKLYAGQRRPDGMKRSEHDDAVAFARFSGRCLHRPGHRADPRSSRCRPPRPAPPARSRQAARAVGGRGEPAIDLTAQRFEHAGNVLVGEHAADRQGASACRPAREARSQRSARRRGCGQRRESTRSRSRQATPGSDRAAAPRASPRSTASRSRSSRGARPAGPRAPSRRCPTCTTPTSAGGGSRSSRPSRIREIPGAIRVLADDEVAIAQPQRRTRVRPRSRPASRAGRPCRRRPADRAGRCRPSRGRWTRDPVPAIPCGRARRMPPPRRRRRRR